ncbi:hypothetical protein [Actinosynnema pretiosum]|uniref:Uncharacterized protein n=1 Tax=Actinosynnema pretiosum TaxID=42197 RepID=A0A290Z754_9PSEU|nr:hypothetical protein [Actinosynnema pretiosum]ATE54850.1 hypothetical protein CNX65_17475 [Actinosynnema pretiosum]
MDGDVRDLRRLVFVLDKVERVVPLVAESSGLAVVRERSPLWADDQRVGSAGMSGAVWGALRESVRCLRAARRSAVREVRASSDSDVGLEWVAQGALLRRALEWACRAVWLVEPPRPERLANLALEAPDPVVVVRRGGESSPAVGADVAQDVWLVCGGEPVELPVAELVGQVVGGGARERADVPLVAAAATVLMVLGRGLELVKERSRAPY